MYQRLKSVVFEHRFGARRRIYPVNTRKTGKMGGETGSLQTASRTTFRIIEISFLPNRARFCGFWANAGLISCILIGSASVEISGRQFSTFSGIRLAIAPDRCQIARSARVFPVILKLTALSRLFMRNRHARAFGDRSPAMIVDMRDQDLPLLLVGDATETPSIKNWHCVGLISPIINRWHFFRPFTGKTSDTLFPSGFCRIAGQS